MNAVRKPPFALAEVVAALVPLAAVADAYASPLPGVTLGALLIAVVTLWALVWRLGPRSTREGAAPIRIAPLVLAGVLVTVGCLHLILLPLGGSFEAFVLNAAKLLVWGAFLTFAGYPVLDERRLYKWMRRVSLAAMAYLFAQYAAWFGAGVLLPNVIPLGLPVYSLDYADTQSYVEYASRIFRPAAFFYESSVLANLFIATLILTLFSPRFGPVKKAFAVLLSIGAILSTSTAGIVLLGCVWVLYAWRRLGPPAAILLSALLGSLYLLSASALAGSAAGDRGVLSRTFGYTLGKVFHLSESVRVGQSFDAIALGERSWVFGHGLGAAVSNAGTETVYLNSVAVLLLRAGALGVVAFLIFLAVRFNYSSSPSVSPLILVYVVKCFQSGIMFNLSGIVFLCPAASITDSEDAKVGRLPERTDESALVEKVKA